FAGYCPRNFRYKQLFVVVEAARIEGRDAEARELYDDAIDAAREGEFTHHEALANELAGRYYLGAGKGKIARFFLEEARQGYLRWGATEKARALGDRHAPLLAVSVPTLLPPRIHSVTTTSTEGAEIIDNAALVRSAQAIVGEID